jgi:hypothetical protein
MNPKQDWAYRLGLLWAEDSRSIAELSKHAKSLVPPGTIKWFKLGMRVGRGEEEAPEAPPPPGPSDIEILAEVDTFAKKLGSTVRDWLTIYDDGSGPSVVISNLIFKGHPAASIDEQQVKEIYEGRMNQLADLEAATYAPTPTPTPTPTPATTPRTEKDIIDEFAMLTALAHDRDATVDDAGLWRGDAWEMYEAEGEEVILRRIEDLKKAISIRETAPRIYKYLDESNEILETDEAKPENLLYISTTEPYHGNVLYYPYALSRKDLIDFDLKLIADDSDYPAVARGVYAELEEEPLYDESAIVWAGHRFGKDYSDITDARDHMYGILSKDLHVYVDEDGQTVIAEMVADMAHEQSGLPPLELIREAAKRAKDPYESALILREIMLYAAGEIKDIKATPNLYVWLLDEYEPETDDQEIDENRQYPLEIASILLEHGKLLGPEARVEFYEDVHGGGVLAAQEARGKAPLLAYDTQTNKWLILTDVVQYLKQFPGRWRQRAFWEETPGF